MGGVFYTDNWGTFDFLNSRSVKTNTEAYLSKLLKWCGNFWGQKSATSVLSVPDVRKLFFEVKYWNKFLFKLFWAPPHAWLGTRIQFLKNGWGGKLIVSKIEFWGFCARIAFLARAKFLKQPLVTLKTYRYSRLFFIYSKNAFCENVARLPPSLAIVGTFLRHFTGWKPLTFVTIVNIDTRIFFSINLECLQMTVHIRCDFFPTIIIIIFFFFYFTIF